MKPVQLPAILAALRQRLHRLRQFQRLGRPSRRQLLLALAALPALFLLYVLLLIPFTPGISDIRKAKQEQPARILFADGKELALFKRSHREWVGLDQISPPVVAALISTEDHRFYRHHGIDWRRTVGAALHTFSGERQGGSTLTQQLARNLYPEEIGRAPTLTRKLKEAITALKIEAVYSKDEILETYLNTVPFLYNAFGIEMAARTYFDTSAQGLDVLQSATLIGMLKGNSYYNPVLYPERALQRRNTVLTQMARHQQLAPEKLEALKKRPLRIDFERQSEPEGPAPHFAQQLRKWLINWADDQGYDLYADGLVVYTPLDSRLQALANQAAARQGRHLQNLADSAWSSRSGWNGRNELVRSLVRETPEYRRAVESGLSPEEALKERLADRAFMAALRQHKTRIQTGFLALDPRNGQVRAWVGSLDFAQDAFDHVQQARRQPGSTFKPFVYALAFVQGARPGDTRIDESVPITLPGGEVWSPSDHTPPSGQPVTLADALIQSKNTIAAQLIQTVGPHRVARLARDMGIRQSKLETVPSLALGTSPVTLKEMVSAYGTIANGGGYLEPVLVTRIEDREGRILAEFGPADPEPVLPAAAAHTLLDVMRGVVDRGTGAAIRSRFGLRADLAGKTGTTQDNADGWFILMHPQLVGGAWVGFNDSRITLRSDYWGQGAHSALPLVGEFFQKSLGARIIDPRARFDEPPETGLWAWGRRLWQRFFGPPAEPERPAPRPAPRQAPSRPGPAPAAPAESAPPAPGAQPEAPPPRDSDGGEAPAGDFRSPGDGTS